MGNGQDQIMKNRWTDVRNSQERFNVGVFVWLSVALFVGITYFHQKSLFDNLYLGSRDLSFFTQSLWNFIQGNGLRTTIGRYGTHLFSEHFYLSHFLLSTIYYFWSSPYALFFIQSLMLGLSGLAVYRIARFKRLGFSSSILLSVLLLCHPTLHGASSGINLYGYHPDCLFPVFFLFAYDAHLRNRTAVFWILVGMALCTLEQAAIVFAAWGLYWFIAGNRKGGLALFLVSFIWYVVATNIAMPMIGGGTPYYFSALKIADSFSELVSAGSAALKYGTSMLLFWGALPLLSPFSLVALPGVLINAQAFSVGYSVPLNLLSWHGVQIVSVLAVSSVNGIYYLRNRVGNYIGWIHAGLAICCIVLGWISFSEVYGQKIRKLTTEQQSALKQLKIDIPEQASLSANFFVASHFSHRKTLYIFPKVNNADYVLISEHEKWEFHQSESKKLYQLRKDKDYQLVFDREGFMLFKKQKSN